MYDIAIIGLGPAGATVARLLNKKYKVIAIDNKNEKMEKCCGGLLSPDSQKTLASLDLCLPKEVLVDPQIFSVRTIDLDNDLEKYYQRFYLNMDRGKFDNWLKSLIPNNVEIVNNATCKYAEMENDYFNLRYLKDGKQYEFSAKVVIGADGANSIIRRTFKKKDKIKKYVAIQEWYKNAKMTPEYTAIFDESLTDSYCWTISKDHNFIVGGAFKREDCNEKFEELKIKLKQHGYKFQEAIKREGCFVDLSNNFNSVYVGRENFYLIGEAAGMISPSSLEGISFAMKSAKILAEVLNKKLQYSNRKYFFKTIKIRNELRMKILKRPFMYNSILRGIVMISNLMAIKKCDNSKNNL